MEALLILILLGFVYFLPTVIALGRKKANAGAIFLVNLFLGWTLLGWFLCLVWACMTASNDPQTAGGTAQ